MDFLGNTIVGEITTSFISFIKRQTGYLLFSNSNIKNLEVELQKLGNKKNAVKLLVDDAKRKLKEINPEVVRWQEQVDGVQGNARGFLENERNNMCLKGWCPNPKSRYSSGRQASKMNENVRSLLQEGESLMNKDKVGLPAPPAEISSTFNIKGIKAFESRRSIENQVWDALKNDNMRMIGICGMGGVGKTTLVKQLMRRVESEKLFDLVAMAVISQEPDMKRIQDEIAEQLKLTFDHKNTFPVRAAMLHGEIMSSDKQILIILDDIWKDLKFEDVGLPSTDEKGGYMIVLTSRKEDVCSKMGTEMNVKMQVLTNDEAWFLFREIAGNSVDQTLHQTARHVSDECNVNYKEQTLVSTIQVPSIKLF